MGEEATLAVSSLISNFLLRDIDTADLAIAFAAFAVYYIVRVVGMSKSIEDNSFGPVILGAWDLFGQVIVTIVTQYIIIQAQDAIGSRSIDGEALILGFSMTILALVVDEFSLTFNSTLVDTIVYTLGIYYSQLLLRDLVSNRGFLSDPVVVFTLFASYAWLHFYRRIHEYAFANVKHLYIEKIFQIVTRTAKFVLVRWVVHVYEVFVFDDMFHIILWIPHLGGIAILAAFIEGFDAEDAVTVKACLEAFALFLSLAFFNRYGGRFLPDAIFALLFIVIWYILRSISSLPIMHVERGFWWRWLDYTIGVAARVASYLTIQSIIPSVSQSVAHTMNIVERLALYFIIILIASALLWSKL